MSSHPAHPVIYNGPFFSGRLVSSHFSFFWGGQYAMLYSTVLSLDNILSKRTYTHKQRRAVSRGTKGSKDGMYGHILRLY